MARIADRDAGALLELRDRLGGVILDRARSVTGDRLVATLVTCGVLMRVWRCPADFTGGDLRTSLLSLAELRATQWLASTDNPTATTPTARTGQQACDHREDRHMPDEPEKSTSQLTVWWRLVDLLEQLDTTWQQTQAATGVVGSVQLPANLAVALVRAGGHGAAVAAGVAAVLAQQSDSGGRFTQLAGAAQSVDDGWPRRGHRVPAQHQTTNDHAIALVSHGFDATDEWGASDA